MMTVQATSQLLAALLAARKACPPTVHKASRNQEQGYNYAGHEAVLLGGARDHLLAHGLVLVQVGTEFAGADIARSKSGERTIWRWRGAFKLLHTESGEALDLTFEATTVPNDKAAFVASTALDRTAHLRVLELAGSAEEDPEHDGHDERDPKTPKPRKGKAAKEEPARPAAWWREGHAGMVARALKAGIAFEQADEHGLQAPKLPMPVFSAEAQQYPGYAYDKVKAGYLRSVIFNSDNFGTQPAPVRLWVSYLVARHELVKLEQEAAEQALGGKAATT